MIRSGASAKRRRERSGHFSSAKRNEQCLKFAGIPVIIDPTMDPQEPVRFITRTNSITLRNVTSAASPAPGPSAPPVPE